MKTDAKVIATLRRTFILLMAFAVVLTLLALMTKWRGLQIISLVATTAATSVMTVAWYLMRD